MPNAAEIYGRLWTEKYAALATAARDGEETRRAEAFVDVPRRVAGCSIRPLTGYDLLILDGYEHPLVGSSARAALTTPAELIWFLWYQRADQRPLWFPRLASSRFASRCSRAWLDAAGRPTAAYTFNALPEALAYIEAAFADSATPRRINEVTGQPEPVRESSTSFLAPLVMTLAGATGWSEQHILNLPLARLWQYLKIHRDEQRVGPGAEHSTVARLRSQCLQETNAELRRLAAS